METGFDWSQFSTLEAVLIMGIIWLSGVFLYMLRKFVVSFEANTRVMDEVGRTLVSMNDKLATAERRDERVEALLRELNVQQEPPKVEVIVPDRQSHG